MWVSSVFRRFTLGKLYYVTQSQGFHELQYFVIRCRQRIHYDIIVTWPSENVTYVLSSLGVDWYHLLKTYFPFRDKGSLTHLCQPILPYVFTSPSYRWHFALGVAVLAPNDQKSMQVGGGQALYISAKSVSNSSWCYSVPEKAVCINKRKHQ